MSQNKIEYSNYELKNVTTESSLWEGKDPVRPTLSSSFRTDKGRRVYALISPSNQPVAFLCLATTREVPYDEESLEAFTCEYGSIAVPYTVWSYQSGAGKEIIRRVIGETKESATIERVVTLSPLTPMARNFHLKNNATEFRLNKFTVNFEYKE